MATIMLLRYMGKEALKNWAWKQHVPPVQTVGAMADSGALLFGKEKEKATDRWSIPRTIEREMGSRADESAAWA